MRIDCCVTPAHEVLLEEFFRPSLPKGFTLCCHRLDIQGAGNYLDGAFLECIRRKQLLVLESLKNGGEHELVVWSDVDICFFEKEGHVQEKAWKQQMQERGAEILFQREGHNLPDVNTGFFVTKRTEAVRTFFDRVMAVLENEHGWNEQRAVNYLLAGQGANGPGLRWEYLPWGYYARTHGWPPPRDAVLYHANFTKEGDALAQKRRQLSRAGRYMRGGCFSRWLIHLSVLQERGLVGIGKAFGDRLKRLGAVESKK